MSIKSGALSGKALISSLSNRWICCFTPWRRRVI